LYLENDVEGRFSVGCAICGIRRCEFIGGAASELSARRRPRIRECSPSRAGRLVYSCIPEHQPYLHCTYSRTRLWSSAVTSVNRQTRLFFERGGSPPRESSRRRSRCVDHHYGPLVPPRHTTLHSMSGLPGQGLRTAYGDPTPWCSNAINGWHVYPGRAIHAACRQSSRSSTHSASGAVPFVLFLLSIAPRPPFLIKELSLFRPLCDLMGGNNTARPARFNVQRSTPDERSCADWKSESGKCVCVYHEYLPKNSAHCTWQLDKDQRYRRGEPSWFLNF